MVLNSFGLWVAVRLLGTGYSDAEVNAGFGLFLIAGLIFSVINSILRPVVVILSLPAIHHSWLICISGQWYYGLHIFALSTWSTHDILALNFNRNDTKSGKLYSK